MKKLIRKSHQRKRTRTREKQVHLVKILVKVPRGKDLMPEIQKLWRQKKFGTKPIKSQERSKKSWGVDVKKG